MTTRIRATIRTPRARPGYTPPRRTRPPLRSLYTTFCYKPVVKIEGNVYEDTNGDGAKNGSESAFATTRTVTLDNGASTTTDSNGNYTFYVAAGGTYTVASIQNLSSEAQTQPSGSTAPVGSDYCHTDPTSPDTASRQRLTSRTSASPYSRHHRRVQRPEDVRLRSAARDVFRHAAARAALGGQQLVFNTWSDSGAHFASLHPTSTGLPRVSSARARTATSCSSRSRGRSLPDRPLPLKYSDAIPRPRSRAGRTCRTGGQS
jgi:hypothetical protein